MSYCTSVEFGLRFCLLSIRDRPSLSFVSTPSYFIGLICSLWVYIGFCLFTSGHVSLVSVSIDYYY